MSILFLWTRIRGMGCTDSCHTTFSTDLVTPEEPPTLVPLTTMLPNTYYNQTGGYIHTYINVPLPNGQESSNL